jgi:Stress responsive A/B Barrel Domain
MNSISRKFLLVCALSVVFALGVLAGQNKFGQPKTVVHVVAVKWKADSSPEQRQKAIDGVKTMAAEIPGINNIWIKTLKVQGTSPDTPYDAAFVIEFKDEAAHKAYGAHPAHSKWEDIYGVAREQSRNHVITN